MPSPGRTVPPLRTSQKMPRDGHDAVAREVEDRALRVAFLADLADPQADRRPRDDELVADRERAEVDAARRQVLGEGARTERDGRRPAEPRSFCSSMSSIMRSETCRWPKSLWASPSIPSPGDELDRRGRAS